MGAGVDRVSMSRSRLRKKRNITTIAITSNAHITPSAIAASLALLSVPVNQVMNEYEIIRKGNIVKLSTFKFKKP